MSTRHTASTELAISPRRPRTSTTSGTSQIRNWGESTFPKTTKAQTAAAQARKSRSGSAGPRANQRQIQSRTAISTRLWTTASASAVPPERFCEPWLETIVKPSPKIWWSTSSAPEPSVSICKGRVVWRRLLSHTPCGLSARKGITKTATTPAATPSEIQASRRPRRLQTQATKSGSSTSG